MKQHKVAYAAIREDPTTGDEYIDLESIACLAEEARKKASETNKQIPRWTHTNPVRRIGEIEIFEV